ncbi:Hsp20/alpha crystallin family protein [Piscinibacter koreensis]|uniref:Hsp20/alpha crystallin family protein n=1 Tax=Piscinibacter koreensis TaxID=2742824 RepID=A0A7Y6NMF5_9BURK|nr:Hsp20/alpha crystallin family protein [Schlegelella koreensis]NUZ05893.1 Hsp20/alpha crystallin family protein [Schlegelella koreensis]
MSDNTNTQVTQAGRAGEPQTQAQGQRQQPQATVAPPVDIIENEVGISLLADMPGVSKERLGVRVDGDTLVIEGAASVDVPEKLELLYGEVRNPYFRRSFTLSRELDASKIEASLRDGVLRLHIPKAEEARPRRIDVRVG